MEDGGEEDVGGEDAGGEEEGALVELDADVVVDGDVADVPEAGADGIDEAAAAEGADVLAEELDEEPPPHDVQMSAAAKTAITDLIEAPPHGLSRRVRFRRRRKRAQWLNGGSLPQAAAA